jgi:hypothetical protein
MFSADGTVDRKLFFGIDGCVIEEIPQKIIDIYKQIVQMNIPVKSDTIFLEFEKANKKIFEEKNAPLLSGSTYAHNYSRQNNPVLFSDKFSEPIKKFPLFGKEDAVILARYLKDKLHGGGGELLFERFTGSPVRPSKRLLDHSTI